MQFQSSIRFIFAVAAFGLLAQIAILGQQPPAAASPTPAAQDRAVQLYYSGEAAMTKGTPDSLKKALADLSEAAALFESDGRRAEQGQARLFFGVTQGKLGDDAGALKTYEAVLPLLRETENTWGLGLALNNIGFAANAGGDSVKARACYEEAVKAFHAADDKKQEANVHINLAELFRSQHDTARSNERFTSAATIYHDLGDSSNEALALINQGTMLAQAGEFDLAMTVIGRYRDLGHQTKDASLEGLALVAMGNVASEQHQPAKTVKYCEEALILFRGAKQAENQAIALSTMARARIELNQLDVAKAEFVEAIAIFEGLGQPVEQAKCLVNLGRIEVRLGHAEKGLGIVDGAVKILLAQKDFSTAADANLVLSDLLSQMGRSQAALERAQAALKLFEAGADKAALIRAVTRIGSLYVLLGKLDEAEAEFNSLLESSIARGDKESEAGLRLVLSNNYLNRGDFAKVISSSEAAIAICGPIKEAECEAIGLIGIGAAQAGLSEFQKAIETNERAMVIVKRLQDPVLESTIINNLSTIYSSLGQNDRAEKLIESARSIAIASGNKIGEAMGLANAGKIFVELGSSVEALKYLKQALPMLEEMGITRQAGLVYSNMGIAEMQLGNFDNAILDFEAGRQRLRLVNDRANEALLNLNLGYVQLRDGRLDDAFPNLTKGLTQARDVGDPTSESTALISLCEFWEAKKDPAVAIFYGKAAINIIQSLRARISSMNAATQSGYLARYERGYRLLANLLIKVGRIDEAESVLALLKQDEYFEFVRRDDRVAGDLSVRLSLTTDEKVAFDLYQKNADSLTQLGRERSLLLEESRRFEVGRFPRQARLDELDKLIGSANQVFNAFLDDLKVRFGQTDVRVAVADSGTQALLKELGEPRTVMISTIVTDDQLSLIVTTADAQRAHVVDVKAADLNKLVLEFRGQLRNPKLDPRPTGKKLYDLLFPESLRKDLDGIKADTIVWSLDGTLRYVPMAALWDGKQYLVERYKNVLITLASRDKLAASTVDRKGWRALGVGVSRAATLTGPDGATQNFAALDAVPQELCGLIADPLQKAKCSGTGVIAGTSLLDDQFTLATFNSMLGRFPVVHIASHFSLNAGSERDSYLLLGGGPERKLTLAAVRQGSAKFAGVELLTLSACNTAMSSGAKANGVEVEGFGTLAQNQGARAVLASLWAVADSSTRDLMLGFYQRLEAPKVVSKAEALRQAQLALLKGSNANGPAGQGDRSELVQVAGESVATFKPDPNAPFAHPYYWAPFILIGNWR